MSAKNWVRLFTVSVHVMSWIEKRAARSIGLETWRAMQGNYRNDLEEEIESMVEASP